MRILMVGHFKSSFYYGIMPKLHNGFIRLGHTVQIFDDRLMARYATPLRSRKFGILPMNKQLLQVCKHFSPHVIVLGHCEMVWNSTLESIRQALPDCRLLYRNVDPLYTPENQADIARRSGYVDLITTTTAGDGLRNFLHPLTNVCFMPNPIDSSIEDGKAFATLNPSHDIFYGVGGTFTGDTRPAVITRLQTALPQAKWRIHGPLGLPFIDGYAYMQTLRNSKIGLNYSRRNNDPWYSSDRMAQYLGNGLLITLDKATGFDSLFKDSHALIYEDIDELIDKLRNVLANDNERQRIARQGWELGHRVFACERVAQYLLDQLFKQPLSNDYEWPTILHTA
jgi:hypothetical protein